MLCEFLVSVCPEECSHIRGVPVLLTCQEVRPLRTTRTPVPIDHAHPVTAHPPRHRQEADV
jgi:hypothetical protein